MNKPRRKATSGGWRLQDDRPPTFRGWISTDEGEIRRREWRGRTEIVDVHALDGSPHPFGDYQVTSSNGSSYTVEIRSLGTHINSCGCRDHRTNRLGTCKHIEGVLHRLRGNRAAPPRRRKPKGQESSGRIEIFLDERDDRAVRMTVPEAIERADPAFVQEAGRHYRSLRRDSRKAFDSLHDMARAHPDRLRVSRSLETWIDARKAPARRRRERDRFVAGGFAEEARAPAVEAARLAVAALAAMRGKPEPGDAESAAEFLLGEEPDGIPGGPPHDAIRARSGDEPEDGEVARIEDFVSRIFWMVADMSAPSHGEPPEALSKRRPRRASHIRLTNGAAPHDAEAAPHLCGNRGRERALLRSLAETAM